MNRQGIAGEKSGVRGGRGLRVFALVLLAVGVLLMLVCGFTAAHYSNRAATQWFDEASRYRAAYEDTMQSVLSQTGESPDGITAETLAETEKAAKDKTWSADYDPPGGGRDQRTANVVGMFGVLGLFVFIGGLTAAFFGYFRPSSPVSPVSSR